MKPSREGIRFKLWLDGKRGLSKPPIPFSCPPPPPPGLGPVIGRRSVIDLELCIMGLGGGIGSFMMN